MLRRNVSARKDSVNDRMVKWTSLPAIYLWIAASGTVIFYGIFKPDIVLPNVEAFIALIAIIGGYASQAYATILELWKAEQVVETELHPDVVASSQDMANEQAIHDRKIHEMELKHRHMLDVKDQEHRHCLEHEKQRHELGGSEE
jgi:hypothetical protein